MSYILDVSEDYDKYRCEFYLVEVTFIISLSTVCSASMVTPHFDKIITTPWATLEQEYYLCYLRSSDALINAIGVALGNASIIYSFSIIFILYSAMGISVLIWPRWRYKTSEEQLEKHRQRDIMSDSSSQNPLGIQLKVLSSPASSPHTEQSQIIHKSILKVDSKVFEIDSDDEEEDS